VACTEGTVYNQYEPTPLNGWERNDTITFQTEAMESAGNYLEEVGIRINADYPFASLSLVVDQTVTPSNKTYTDTLTCRLFDDSGKALGNGISLYQYILPLTTLKLDKGECVRVAIHHCMKREILPGIMDVGVKLSH
jgi:gliding motility-associated lipoprotein GldH